MVVYYDAIGLRWSMRASYLLRSLNAEAILDGKRGLCIYYMAQKYDNDVWYLARCTKGMATEMDYIATRC